MDEKEHDAQIEYEKPTESTLGGAGEDLSNEEYAKRESAVVWKLDCFIAPVMMLLMLISYLDRGNVRSLPLGSNIILDFLLICCNRLALRPRRASTLISDSRGIN